MGMKLSDVDILRLLPVFMRDNEANRAFAKALNDIFRALAADIPRLREWDQIDNMTGPELDEMAWEMSVEWYDTGMELENKRATIKAAVLLKEKSGTKWAVVEAVKAGYGVVPEILEWYEYGGEPGHFRVNLNALNAFDFAKVHKAIEYVKRASAHLDGIEMYTTEETDLFVGFATVHEYEYANTMDKEEFEFDWLVNELGETLCDELGNVLTEY